MNTVKRHRQDFLNVEGIVVPEETETGIYGLFGKYRALSNFHLAPVIIDGITYRCSEAAYMAEKTDVHSEKIHLSLLDGPEAKKYGQTVTLRPKWNEVRVSAMRYVLWEKFTHSPELEHLLLTTYPKHIEETNWWNDTFWGVCGGVGENHLGQTLMWVRDELMRADSV